MPLNDYIEKKNLFWEVGRWSKKMPILVHVKGKNFVLKMST